MSEQPSFGDILDDPQSEPTTFTVVEDPDEKVKIKPKGKPKARHTLLPDQIVLQTRWIIGLGAAALIVVGLGVFALVQPTSTTPIPLQARSALTSAPILYGSPTAMFAQPGSNLDNQTVVLREDVGGYAAGTVVHIGATGIDNWGRWYNVTVEDGTGLEVAESQLTFIDGTPAPVPPQSQFGHLSETGLYWLVTTDPVAEIPANTRVRVDQAWYDPNSASWMYTVAVYNSAVSFTAYEWELMYSPDEPTPTLP